MEPPAPGVAEGAGVGAEGDGRLRQEEAQPKARHERSQHLVGAERLLGVRALDGLPLENVYAVQLSAPGQCAVDAT